jgi:hypothetical protein
MNMESTRSSRAAARDLYCPTAADLLRPYAKYPPAIQSAILTVDTAPQFINLTKAQKAVLRTLLTRAEQDNGAKPIKVNFWKASQETGVSEKTIARTISLLVDVGWLVRLPTPRDEHGEFSYREFKLTPAFRALVGLPVSSGHHRTLTSRPVNKDLKEKEDQGETCAKAHGKTLDEIDLTPGLDQAAQEFQMSRPGLAVVRGLAHRAGHDPDHIVTVARAYLQKLRLTGNRAINYLKALARKAGDYAVRAADLAHQAHQRAQVSRNRDREALYAGRSFSRSDGMIVRVLAGVAEMWRGGEMTVLPRRELSAVFDAIEHGKLTEIRM